MKRCSLREAVEYLALPYEGKESQKLEQGKNRFIYLINHEYGTGIHVPLWGIRKGEKEETRINLVFLNWIDIKENKAAVKEYQVCLPEDVFSQEEAYERFQEAVFTDVQVDFEALKHLDSFGKTDCRPVSCEEWEKLFFTLAFSGSKEDFLNRAGKACQNLFGRRISREVLEQKTEQMLAGSGK